MIRRLLVVGRNDIAARVFATCRAVGIETVAVFDDSQASAPYVAQADYAVRLASGGSPRDGGMLDALRRSGADAVHPGCGPLAEDPAFATEVDRSGAVWVGPPPTAMAIARSKSASKSILINAGVPVLPAYPTADDIATFPVILKPAAGGSGRGMRVVRDGEGLPEAFASARREAELAFGSSDIFAERYVPGARHVEVQVIADTTGTVVPLGERECSVQRHRRAILVEAPSPAVDPGLRAELFTAAVAATRAIGYVGLGTVEFLLAPSGEFYVLELTPRLQAAHSVTECVFGLDLVRLQLIVAEGGVLPFATAPPMRGHAIESRLTAEDPAYDWRASEGRIRRLEVPGVAHRYGPLIVPGLRMDPAVETGSAVTTRSLAGEDGVPLLARVTAWAPTRHEAARMLATALARTRLHGLTTDRDLLVRVLRHPAFHRGDTTTGFLDRHPDVFAPLLSSLEAVKLSCLAAAVAGAAGQRRAVPIVSSLPTGWRNVACTPQTVAYDAPTGTLEVAYRFDRDGALASWSVRGISREDAGRPGGGPGGADVHTEPDAPAGPGTPRARSGAVAGEAVTDSPDVTILTARPDRVELEVAGVRLVFDVHQADDDPAVCYVDGADGSVALTELPRFPLPARTRPEDRLLAPLPGTVGRVLVVPGQRVAVGDLLLTVQYPVSVTGDGAPAPAHVAAAARVTATGHDPVTSPVVGAAHDATTASSTGAPHDHATALGMGGAPAVANQHGLVEHAIHAPADGVVSDLRVVNGSPVETGTLLAVLALD